MENSGQNFSLARTQNISMACHSPNSLGLARRLTGISAQKAREKFAAPAPEVWVISSTTTLRLQFNEICTPPLPTADLLP